MRFELIQYMDMPCFRQALTTLSYRIPLIIVSKSGAKRWEIERFLNDMQNSGRIIWFSQVDSNPTQYTLIRALMALKDTAIDGIVVIGGGSAMDLAKQISAFYGMPFRDAKTLFKAIQEKKYLSNHTKIVPITAIPTTAGTGSEVTQWASLWDGDSGRKYSIDAAWLVPEAVWMVPELTISLSAKLTLATGLDALCQAIEAYWANASSPIAKALSLQAIAMIANGLKPTLENLTDLTLRENLCTASLLAGLSFSQTRTTACHALSYPMTAHFGIEHGLAVAMTLVPMVEINRKKVDITEVEKLFESYGGIKQWLTNVCGDIVSLRLSAFGVTETDLDDIVHQMFTSGRSDNNPVKLTVELVKHILMRIL